MPKNGGVVLPIDSHRFGDRTARRRVVPGGHPMPRATKAIQHGDCIALMKQMSANSVDLVFADPPFNIGYDYDSYDDRRSADGIPRLVTALDGRRCPGAQAERHLLACHWRRLRGRNEGHRAAGTRPFHPQLGHLVLHVWRQLQGQVLPIAYALVALRDGRRSGSGSRSMPTIRRFASPRRGSWSTPTSGPTRRVGFPDDTWILRPQDLPEGFLPDHDTWYFARVAGTFKERAGFHGCQMPEQLLGRIVRVSSNPGDLVLDPFAGSGTTLAVAKEARPSVVGVRYFEDLRPRGRRATEEDACWPAARRRGRSGNECPVDGRWQAPG